MLLAHCITTPLAYFFFPIYYTTIIWNITFYMLPIFIVNLSKTQKKLNRFRAAVPRCQHYVREC